MTTWPSPVSTAECPYRAAGAGVVSIWDQVSVANSYRHVSSKNVVRPARRTVEDAGGIVAATAWPKRGAGPAPDMTCHSSDSASKRQVSLRADPVPSRPPNSTSPLPTSSAASVCSERAAGPSPSPTSSHVPAPRRPRSTVPVARVRSRSAGALPEEAHTTSYIDSCHHIILEALGRSDRRPAIIVPGNDQDSTDLTIGLRAGAGLLSAPSCPFVELFTSETSRINKRLSKTIRCPSVHTQGVKQSLMSDLARGRGSNGNHLGRSGRSADQTAHPPSPPPPPVRARWRSRRRRQSRPRDPIPRPIERASKRMRNRVAGPGLPPPPGAPPALGPAAAEGKGDAPF